ncbi:MAG: cysteine rich repeat-containing protein [Roseiarcus sp.]|jgi:hypothetical protein
MMIRRTLITVVVLGVSSMALANTSGTPDQRAACGPDVHKFCHKLKEADGDMAYLQCLELNRDSLSAPCSTMLKGFGK